MNTQNNVVLSIQEEISKWILARGHNNHLPGEIYFSIREIVFETYNLSEFEVVLYKMVKDGKLKNTYLVVYRKENIKYFDKVEDIPETFDNPYAYEFEGEGEKFETKDAEIIKHYGHVDWKEATPEEQFWKHPPYVYRPEHAQHVLENFEGEIVLVWSGSWCKLQDWAMLKPGDIWKPLSMNPPNDRLLEESMKIVEECASSQ